MAIKTCKIVNKQLISLEVKPRKNLLKEGNGINVFVNIGGHGFWDKGGVYTLGVSEKNFVAASGGRNTWV